MFAETSRRYLSASARIAVLVAVPLLMLALLEPSASSVDAVFQNNLILSSNNFTIPPPKFSEGGPPPAAAAGSGGDGSGGDGSGGPPPIPNCMYALGLGDRYSVINDNCITTRWRPGQTWKFDDTYVDGYQPIRVGSQYCLSTEDARVSSKAIVVACPNDNNGVPSEAQWRLGTNGKGDFWFRQLRTKLCLRGHADEDSFTIDYCGDDPAFFFQLKTF